MPETGAKICGLNDPDSVRIATEEGAAFIGLLFYPPSPRAVSPEQAASLLPAMVPAAGTGRKARTVGLFVNPDDALLDSVLDKVPLDLLQLHGDESPERTAEIRSRTGRPVIRAIRVGSAADIEDAHRYEAVADWLLFDARPGAPVSADRPLLPGGNALRFDWRLLTGQTFTRPWMLAGGLDAANVADAVKATGANYVDTSSGVEDSPGKKNGNRIRQFLAASRAAFRG